MAGNVLGMKIYQTVEPVPSRVIGLLRLLRSYGNQGLTRDAVVELLQPKTIGTKEDADTLAANTILAVKELLSQENRLIVERDTYIDGPARLVIGRDLR